MRKKEIRNFFPRAIKAIVCPMLKMLNIHKTFTSFLLHIQLKKITLPIFPFNRTKHKRALWLMVEIYNSSVRPLTHVRSYQKACSQYHDEKVHIYGGGS